MKTVGSISRIGWRVAIAGVLLGWIFHSIFSLEGRQTWEELGNSWTQLSRLEQWKIAWFYGPGKLWHTVTPVQIGNLIFSLGFMGMTILLGLVRWRMVLQLHGLNLAFGRTVEISLVAHFFNSFLLGSTGGDLLKAYYAARETHHKKTEAVMTVFIDRVVGLFAMLLFAGLMIAANYSLVGSHRSLRALAGFIFVMMLGCGAVVGLSFWGGVSRWWPRARAWMREWPKGESIERALDAARLLGRRPSLFLRLLLVSMVLNVFCVLQVLTLASGLNLQVSSKAMFAIVPVIVCISALPISPSGLGVRENLYVLTLGVPEINVAATAALALSLLAYAGSLCWSVLGGIVYLTRRARDHLAEVAQNDANQVEQEQRNSSVGPLAK